VASGILVSSERGHAPFIHYQITCYTTSRRSFSATAPFGSLNSVPNSPSLSPQANSSHQPTGQLLSLSTYNLDQQDVRLISSKRGPEQRGCAQRHVRIDVEYPPNCTANAQLSPNLYGNRVTSHSAEPNRAVQSTCVLSSHRPLDGPTTQCDSHHPNAGRLGFGCSL
jgi:hypothetical protein